MIGYRLVDSATKPYLLLPILQKKCMRLVVKARQDPTYAITEILVTLIRAIFAPTKIIHLRILNQLLFTWPHKWTFNRFVAKYRKPTPSRTAQYINSNSLYYIISMVCGNERPFLFICDIFQKSIPSSPRLIFAGVYAKLLPLHLKRHSILRSKMFNEHRVLSRVISNSMIKMSNDNRIALLYQLMQQDDRINSTTYGDDVFCHS